MKTLSVPHLDLWEGRRTGDRRVFIRLIEEYGYLVKNTVNRIASGVPPNIDRDDLIQAGFLGLIRAVNEFDLARNIKFNTYAITLIRGAVLEFLRGEDFVPRSGRDKEKAELRLEEEGYRHYGRPLTDQEKADQLGLTLDSYYQYQSNAIVRQIVSLEEPLFLDQSDEGTLTIESTCQANVEDHFDVMGRSLRQARVVRAINRLPEREQRVLELYYRQEWTFKEIGQHLEVTESRAFQLHQQAMRRMRIDIGNPENLYGIDIQRTTPAPTALISVVVPVDGPFDIHIKAITAYQTKLDALITNADYKIKATENKLDLLLSEPKRLNRVEQEVERMSAVWSDDQVRTKSPYSEHADHLDQLLTKVRDRRVVLTQAIPQNRSLIRRLRAKRQHYLALQRKASILLEEAKKMKQESPPAFGQ